MENNLYKRSLYTKKVSYLINEIYEYDISKANVSILLESGMITQETYDMFCQMPKYQREVAIGYMQKNKKISDALKIGFENSRKMLIEYNSLTEDDVLSIKKDAFYVLRKLNQTKFGLINFTLRNRYDIYINCRNIEIYYGLNALDNTDDSVIDIKGITDDNLKSYHSTYLSFIAYILKLIVTSNIDSAIQELISFIQKYDNKELDIDYYREFNSQSMFRIGQYGVRFIDESYKDCLDISCNQLFNRELFSILMDIKYKK